MPRSANRRYREKICAMLRSRSRALGLMALAALSVTLVQCEGGSTSALPAPGQSATPAPASTATADPGGQITFTVPTPSPILCSPAPITVAVGQHVLVDCTAQGYVGPFTWSVADPTIVSIQQFNDETYTYFTAVGLKAGSTMLSLQSLPGGTGSDTITVSP